MLENRFDNRTPIFQLTVGEFLSIIRQEHKPQVIENEIPEIFGVENLQKLTGYSKATIYAKTSRNELPHFKRDGRLFFQREAIMNWLTAKPVATLDEHCRIMDEKLTKKGRRG